MQRDPGPRYKPRSEPQPLNRVSTQDTYVAALTLFCPGSKVLILQVNNAGCRHQLGVGPSLEAMQWLPEEFDQPANYVLDDEPFDACRFKSDIAGTPAVITARPK